MKKILSIAMGMLMMLTLLPIGAAAYTEDVVKIGNTDLERGYYLASVDGSPVAIGATTPTSYVAMYQDGVLTLKNATISTWYTTDYPSDEPEEFGIYSANDLTIVLVGNNVIGSQGSYPNCSIRSDGVLTVEGKGSLTAYGGYEALNSQAGINIKGGKLMLYAEYPIDSYNNKNGDCRPLTISGGTIFADGLFSGIYCGDGTISGGTVITSGEEEGIYSGDILTVTGGTVTTSGEEKGIDAYIMTVSEGTVTANGGEEGIYTEDTLTVTGGTVTANGGEEGIYIENILTVTGGTVTVNGGEFAVWATDIVLGSDVPIHTGGTLRVVSCFVNYSIGGPYYKFVAEDGLTKYYRNDTETTEDACPPFPETETYHFSTFASRSDFYYGMDSGYVNASKKVVLGAGATSRSTDDDDDDDDEPAITGKIAAYEELSRLSDDYKAMKAYADTLGLGDLQIIGTWDVETKGFGPWKIIFHLDAKYLGDTLTIIHKKDDGTFETFTAVVDRNGEATITVTSASPFLVVRGGASGSAAGGTASVTEENPNTGFDFGWWF